MIGNKTQLFIFTLQFLRWVWDCTLALALNQPMRMPVARFGHVVPRMRPIAGFWERATFRRRRPGALMQTFVR